MSAFSETKTRRCQQEGTVRSSLANQSPQGSINVALSLRERKANLPTRMVAFDGPPNKWTCLGNPANFSTEREGYFFGLASRAKIHLASRRFSSLAVQDVVFV